MRRPPRKTPAAPRTSTKVIGSASSRIRGGGIVKRPTSKSTIAVGTNRRAATMGHDNVAPGIVSVSCVYNNGPQYTAAMRTPSTPAAACNPSVRALSRGRRKSHTAWINPRIAAGITRNKCVIVSRPTSAAIQNKSRVDGMRRVIRYANRIQNAMPRWNVHIPPRAAPRPTIDVRCTRSR